MNLERVVFSDQLNKEIASLRSNVDDIERMLVGARYARAGMFAQSAIGNLGRLIWLLAEGAVRWDRDAA